MIPELAGFLPNSMIEWEDRLAALVLLQGCNFRCPFCHSAVLVPPGRPGRPVAWDAVRDKLAGDRDWIDGVVISGGEPTLHAGLAELAGRLRELDDLPVKLDTNGSNPARVRELVDAGLVQYVAMDVKAPLDAAAYDRATGRPGALDSVRTSLAFLREGRVPCELRTTVCPAVFDDDEQLVALARELSWVRRWYLQPFRPVDCLDPEWRKLPETDYPRLERVAARCRAIAPGCRIRGEPAS